MAKRKTHVGDTKLEPIEIIVSGEKRVFDIGDPVVPDWIEDKKMESGNYPYKEPLKRDHYEKVLEDLQEELVKLQAWLQKTGERMMILFEGRDAAGKGGTIAVFRQFLNPRGARNIALAKPTDTERMQWYFQRYVVHFPTAGEIVTFDRSWYNRGGVEPVMGFCTPEQHRKFLEDAPYFERMVTDEGIHFFKIWLNIGQEMQLRRFHDRVHSRLKSWKFSPMDIAGMTRWDDYTRHRDSMITSTHAEHAPWTVIRANDKRRARIEAIRKVLVSIDYAGRNKKAIGEPDPLIVGAGPAMLDA